MAGCTKYLNRFKKALEYNSLPMPTEMINVIAKRAKSDGEVDSVVHSLLSVLEPPFCQMSHCPYHTSYGFAGCSKSLVPGKCSVHQGYIKRRIEKENKIKSEIVAEMVNDYCVKPEDIEDNYQRILRNCGGISRIKSWWDKNKPKNKIKKS